MKYRGVQGMLVVAAFAAVACTDEVPTAARSLMTAGAVTSETEPATGPWSRIVEGQTGPGAQYAVYVPRTWNGSAVFYAHGFRDAGTDVDLRDQDQFYATRDALGAMGFAFAYSSYSENGFAVKDGAQRTHQLRGLATSALGSAPVSSYLVGHSLGGGVALDLAERYSGQYDGALLVCGMVGGSLLQTQYLGDARALFDAYFPGSLPGNAIGVPAGTVVTIPQIVAAVQSNPLALFTIASMRQTPLPFVPVGNPTDPSSPAFQTLVGSLFGAVSFHARGINNVLDLTHGATPFGNDATEYALGTPLLPAGVLQPLVTYANANVTRYTMDPSAANYLEREFSPTGDLRMPMLTLHNAWDPAVPLFHEAALRERVQAAGQGANLLQRTVPSFGHCNISSAMTVQAFTDLVNWKVTGTKPAS